MRACRRDAVETTVAQMLWALHCQRGPDGRPRWSVEELLADHAVWREFVAARQGDEEASRRFHDRWAGQIAAFCGARAMREHADEMTATFFERAWRLVPIDHSWASPFTAYLRTMIVNLARDLRARQARRRELERPLGGGNDGEAVVDPPSRAPSPEQGAIDAQVVARVRAALAELSPGDQHLLLACLVDGAEGKELAAIMGIEGNAFYQRLHRARKRLEARLVEEGILPKSQGRRGSKP